MTSVSLVVQLGALAHANDAAAQAYTKWSLAEGATGLAAGFFEDILIANPGSVDAQIRITFLTGTGQAPSPYELTVKATSRATVRLNQLPGLHSTEVSAIVESLNGVNIVVERTMSWPTSTLRGAHNSTGVTGTAIQWFFAEGSTGLFNTFVLIANPDDTQTARVKVTFFRPGGGSVPYRPDPADPDVHEFNLGVTNGGITRTLPSSFTYSTPGLCPLCRFRD